MFIYNGKKISIDNPIEVNGVRYTDLRDPEIRAALGVTEAPDPVIPDQEFYITTQETDGTVTSTPRDFSQVQAAQIAKVNATAGTLLQPTDWQVIRKMERGVAIGPSVETYRASVVSASNATVAELQAATTIEQLQAIAAPSWPAPL